MRFIKMHGTGNDFIMLNGISQPIRLTPSLIKQMCDRRYGIGADGVIIALKPTTSNHRSSRCLRIRGAPLVSIGARGLTSADFRMRIFNADGSEPEMCGNGIRCLAKMLYDLRLTKSKNLSIETKGGLMRVNLDVSGKRVSNVTVRLPEPRKVEDYSAKNLPLPYKTSVTAVQLSNPHCVVFVKDVDRFPVEKYGPLIERHRLFPNRTNVEFVQILSRNRIKMRVWERGVGETLACGTGACAAVVAGVMRRKLSNSAQVILKGGNLNITYIQNRGIYLSGPAKTTFTGEYSF